MNRDGNITGKGAAMFHSSRQPANCSCWLCPGENPEAEGWIRRFRLIRAVGKSMGTCHEVTDERASRDLFRFSDQRPLGGELPDSTPWSSGGARQSGSCL